MRIIGGKYGGRIIKPPKSLQARPTTDFAKENLFNILENRVYFEHLAALDLFAGTGNISFELLSRGCRHVTAVEKNPVNRKFISYMAGKLKVENLTVVQSDAFKFMASAREKFGLIFADPPYHLPDVEKIPTLIDQYHLLHEAGYFILEHGKNINFSNFPFYTEQRKYGQVHFSFFRFNPST